VHPFLTASGPSGTFTVPDHGDDTYFELRLTATDSGGLGHTATLNVTPQTVQITLQSNPTGLQVVYGGQTITAPVTHNAVINSTISISAPSPQGTQQFVSWSDGGAQSHNIVATTNTTYTATFSGTDTTPPIITARTPAANQTEVPTGTAVTATFSEPMNASTITGSTFSLRKQGAATDVATTVTYDAASVRATLQPSSALDVNATYVVTVKGGSSGVRDAAGNPLATDSTWSFTTASQAAVYLSDMTWLSETNGWGPIERDRSNGGQAAGDGLPIRLNGVTYAKGLGMHAPGEVRVSIGSCPAFAAHIGVDDEVDTSGSVTFEVWGDAVKLFDSGMMTGASATQAVNVSLAGRTTLRLVVTNGGDNVFSDHADWADARLICTADTTAPTVTTRTPAPGATGVAITSAVSAEFSEPLNPATLTSATFTLRRQGATANVAATVSYNALTRTATLQPGAVLEGSSVYNVTLTTGVMDTAGNPLAAAVTWSFTTTSQAAVYLSDMTWLSETNGWGPIERDRSNGGQAAGDGLPIRLKV
jgi:hypothetical protein